MQVRSLHSANFIPAATQRANSDAEGRVRSNYYWERDQRVDKQGNNIIILIKSSLNVTD